MRLYVKFTGGSRFHSSIGVLYKLTILGFTVTVTSMGTLKATDIVETPCNGDITIYSYGTWSSFLNVRSSHIKPQAHPSLHPFGVVYIGTSLAEHQDWVGIDWINYPEYVFTFQRWKLPHTGASNRMNTDRVEYGESIQSLATTRLEKKNKFIQMHILPWETSSLRKNSLHYQSRRSSNLFPHCRFT